MERHSSLIVPRYFSLPLVLRSTMCVPLVPQLSKKLDVDLGQGDAEIIFFNIES